MLKATTMTGFGAHRASEQWVSGALGLLDNETNGFAIDATTADGGTVAVIDVGTPANDLSDVILNASNLVQSGTSPKQVYHLSSPYVRWSAHNLFLNSAAPATQNVTLVVGFVYTVTVTGAGGGSITGSDGASGVATTGSPATFTATTTTGTFTYAATLTTIQLNRGAVATPYLVTTGAIRIGIPQSYDVVAGKYGLYPEPAATNLALYSQELGNGDTATGVTVTDNAATAPDGSATASTFTISGTSSTHDSYRAGASCVVSSGSTNTYSIYLKQGSGARYANFAPGGSAGNEWIQVVADLQAGTITQAGAWAGATYTSSSITSIGDGWYRVTVTGIISTDTSIFLELQMCSTASNGTFAAGNFGLQAAYSGNGTDTMHAWGRQGEAGTVATSYIPTVGATATRAADNINCATSSIPFSATEGTVYFDGVAAAAVPANQFGWQLDDGTANEKIRFYRDTSNNPTASIIDGGAEQLAPMDLGTVTPSARSQATLAWKANLAAGSFNAGGAVDDTTLSLPTVTTFRLGADINVTHWNSYIYRIIYVPRQIEEDADTVEAWRYNF
jgi:hypothetical protein